MEKTRVIQGPSYVAQEYLSGSPYGQNGKTFGSVQEAQYVYSEGHPYRNLGKGGDVGGPFLSQKIEISGDLEPIWLNYRDRYVDFTRLYPTFAARDAVRGGFGTGTENIKTRLSQLCPPFIHGNTLDANGATAISRVQPTSPVFDGATALAELFAERKLFSVPGKNGSMSGEYLNYQLGISPAVGAYSDFREAMARSEEILAQLHRDSGKRVRRQYRFPTESSNSVKLSTSYPVGDTSSLDARQVGTGSIIERTHTTTEKWFSGAFTYHLPKEVGFQRTLAELDAVYGVKPGLDTAWELIPFSFVADYFANFGDVLKNVNAFASDGVVMIYGYMMAKTVMDKSWTWSGPVRSNPWGSMYTTHRSVSIKCTTMQRVAANPFGFGVLDSDLSLRQLSILAALGINRR